MGETEPENQNPEIEVTEEKEEPPGQLVLVGKIRDMFVGIPIDQIKGVDRVEAATPLPGTPDFIAGLVFIRGGIEAGVDLGVIFGEKEMEITNETRAVLFDVEGGRGAILFDQLLDMPSIKQDDVLQSKFKNIPKEPVLGQFSWRDKDVILISPSGLYTYAIDFEM